MHFFVSELCFAENFRFELELDKLLDPFSLDQYLGSFFVNGHAEFVFLAEENRVILGTEFESQLIEQTAQLRDLCRGESVSVRIHRGACASPVVVGVSPAYLRTAWRAADT